MKEVSLKVRADKYDFFVELIRNFDFVTINKNPKGKETLLLIAKGMKEAQLAAKGKIKTKSAKSFVNAL